MAKTQKRATGDLGEDIACKYLEDKGYSVIERNYWKPWGEIDIIGKKDQVLSFVEVKSVSRESIRPEENFHPAKLKRLHRAIQTYLLDHKVPETQVWQIDLICVFIDISTKKARVELLENVIL